MYLLNAFSLNMLADSAIINTVKGDLKDVLDTINIEADGLVNAIGHQDTDAVVRDFLNPGLNRPLPVGQRLSVTLGRGDSAIVAQYTGPRLPEGATTLPEGAKIVWWYVEIN